ncbi:inner membrane protein YiaA [Aquimarina agarivorans]|uniref:inner membrane protein YiaA n=1 Tax=Aquimarina agarivorans TaxID=980584 RepID=UPI000248EFCD|nr:inner membrane protein YiaA [Aquimarina agarivorans]
MEYKFSNEVTEEKGVEHTENNKTVVFDQKPTPAFTGASWVALMAGIVAFCIGLFNTEMQLNEKGYYFTILLFGLFSAVSVQKNVRDKLEGLSVTEMYYGISWFAALASITLLVIGLWNADLDLSEKGFYSMSFLLSLFSAIAVQKNTRDKKYIDSLKEK